MLNEPWGITIVCHRDALQALADSHTQGMVLCMQCGLLSDVAVGSPLCVGVARFDILYKPKNYCLWFVF